MHDSQFDFLETALLHLEATRDAIRLVTNATELIFQSGEMQCIDCAWVCLQIIDPTQHWLTGVNVLVGNSHAVETAIE